MSNSPIAGWQIYQGQVLKPIVSARSQGLARSDDEQIAGFSTRAGYDVRPAKRDLYIGEYLYIYSIYRTTVPVCGIFGYPKRGPGQS